MTGQGDEGQGGSCDATGKRVDRSYAFCRMLIQKNDPLFCQIDA